jgi:hypothetical protein
MNCVPIAWPVAGTSQQFRLGLAGATGSGKLKMLKVFSV